MPILWAVLPPLAIGYAERLAFHTTYFGSTIGNRFTGGSEGTAIIGNGRTMNPVVPHSVLHFLISPGLWIGLALTVAFIGIAVRIRRDRGPI